MRQNNQFATLLLTNEESESFVRRSLAMLEADFRKLALLGLSDWSQLELVSAEMFHAVASLQRPSWGMWNGLLSALRNARKNKLRNAGDNERHLVEGAELLQAILLKLEGRVESGLVDELRPLSELTRTPISRKLRLGAVLTLPISLRNRIAHDAPTSMAWWNDTAAALHPLVEFHARHAPLSELLADNHQYVSPWFRADDKGALWTFNGLNNDMAVVYVSDDGETDYSSNHAADVITAFQSLLGKTEAQDADFRKLLSKLAPEEIKGVMMGDYLVGKPVGSGGFATVHVSRQLSTGRKVAVKVLHDGQSESVEERFQQEARFLSMFDNPHVVSVYGYGQEAWQAPRRISLASEEWFESFSRSAPVKSFIAMEWIEGDTLDAVFVRPQEERPPVRKVAEWFSQAAEALSTVHQAGLIHRDIKPSNLMVDENGNIKLMDFGIARHQGEHRTLKTTTGKVIGTPAYLSPEQIRNSDDVDEVGAPTDVYSLCATFYELSTGARVYDHDTSTLEMVTTKKIRGDRVARPRSKRGGLPWELDTILMGGLEPDAKDRYQSMDTLKRDIDHYLRDEPIEYRRPHLARRIQLAFRRNRTVATLLTVLFFGLIVAAVGSTYAAIVYSEMANTEQKLRNETRENLYVAEMSGGAEAAKSVSGINRLEEIVNNWIPKGDEKDLRGWEWYWLGSITEREELVVQTFPDGWINAPVHSVDFSPDGSLIAWSIFSVVQVARVDGIEVIAEFEPDPHKRIFCVRFSNDGRYIAACGGDQKCRIWDVESKRLVLENELPAAVGAVCWSPDDRLVAFQTYFKDPASIHIVEIEISEETKAFEILDVEILDVEIDGHIRSIDFSPDGRWFASAGFTPYTNHFVNVWNTSNWELLDRKLLHRRPVTAVAWSSDSTRVASASEDGAVKIWEVEKKSDEVITITEGGLGRMSVAWGPDDRFVIAGGRDFSATIWDATDGTEVDVLRGHTAVVEGVAWNAAEALVATTGTDGYVRLWDMSRAPPVRSLKQCSTTVEHDGGYVSWSRDGTRVAAANNHPFTIWNAESGQPLFLHTVPDNDIGSTQLGNGIKEFTQLGSRPCWSSDGEFLVSSYRDIITFWNGNGDEQLHTIPKNGMTYRSFSPAKGDHRLAMTLTPAEGHSSILMYDPTADEERREVATGLDKIEKLAWSFDGTKILIVMTKTKLAMIDSATGKRLGEFTAKIPIESIAWSPDGEHVVTGNRDHTATIRDSETFQEVKVLRGHTFSVWSVAWSSDGQRIATASGDKTVRLWNPENGKTTIVFEHDDEVKSVAWSPDGRRLASMSQDAIMKIWDASSGYDIESKVASESKGSNQED